MKRIRVLTNATSKNENLWGSVKKFFEILGTKFDGTVKRIEYYRREGHEQTVFDIYVRKCKRSVWKNLLKSIREAKKYFVEDYMVENIEDQAEWVE